MIRHAIAANNARKPSEARKKRARLSKGSVAFPKGGDIPVESLWWNNALFDIIRSRGSLGQFGWSWYTIQESLDGY